MTDKADVSGSFAIAPGSSSVGHADGFNISSKTLIMALILFAGGSVGGGGVSLFAGPKGIQEVKEEVMAAKVSTNGKIDQLSSKMETINISIVDVRADLKISKSDFQRLESELKELKVRVSNIEQQRRR